MTFKQTLSKYLPSKNRLSESQKKRLEALREIDKMREINKRLPVEYLAKLISE